MLVRLMVNDPVTLHVSFARLATHGCVRRELPKLGIGPVVPEPYRTEQRAKGKRDDDVRTTHPLEFCI